MSTFSWTCPFCSQPTTVTKNDFSAKVDDLWIDNSDGDLRLIHQFIVCPSTDCKKVSLELMLHERTQDALGNPKTGNLIKHWQLIPSSNAKVFPDYIPAPILEDYNEACLIRDLSPKASATLSRRCLQGILRDFWGVKPKRLADEIESIKDKVDHLTWDAIDSVRKIGNIGAHMEKDINVIVDVEPEEAELLLNLIEMLLKDWYILREERKNRLHKIVQTSKQKHADKQGNP